MEQYIPQILGLILILGMATIIAVVLIAIVRPDQLKTVVALVKAIVLALLHRDVEIEVQVKRRGKDEDI